MSDSPEDHFARVDWDNTSEAETSRIIEHQTQYAMASVKLVYAAAMYGSDMKNLLASLILSLILSFLSMEPKNIIVSLLMMQALFAFISRVGSLYNARSLNELKNVYIELLKKHKKE